MRKNSEYIQFKSRLEGKQGNTQISANNLDETQEWGKWRTTGRFNFLHWWACSCEKCISVRFWPPEAAEKDQPEKWARSLLAKTFGPVVLWKLPASCLPGKGPAVMRFPSNQPLPPEASRGKLLRFSGHSTTSCCCLKSALHSQNMTTGPLLVLIPYHLSTSQRQR